MKNSDAIHREKEKYEAYLDSHGLRSSSGRRRVFDQAIHSHGHFTAEELSRDCQNVSRATVYRVIKELLEAGVIRETAYGDKHNHYEHVYDETLHHHAHCVRCHQHIEIPDLKEDEVYRPLLQKKGFKVLGHEMHFYGICQQCQQQGG